MKHLPLLLHTVLYCMLCVTIRQVKKEPLIGALTDYCIKDMGMVLKTSALANISGTLNESR
jgi:hypothetical protein